MDFKAYLIDLDGCVYRGDDMIPGADEAIKALRKRGRAVLFLTNNSTGTPHQYSEKLRGFGIDSRPEDIMTSSTAIAIYLRGLERGGVYVLGEEALKEAVAKEGFQILSEADATRAKYVISGLDRKFNYQKLSAACSAIFNGARYIASNADPTLPTKDGMLPGAGAIVSAISKTTGVKPKIVGKPSKMIIDLALARIGARHSEAAIVGDSLAMDVAAGRKAGIYTILVLTGVSRGKDIGAGVLKPDLVLKGIKDITEYL